MAYGKEFGVMLGDKHSYRDYGLILTNKVIGEAEAQLKLVSVPMRDGSLDMTESLSGDIKYKSRTITIEFVYPGTKEDGSAKYSELQNALHGQQIELIFDDDIAFYYEGRLSIKSWGYIGNAGKIVMEIIADPYKYDLTASDAEWEWDPFDFENGIINEGGDIEIDGETTINIIARRKKQYAIIDSSSADITVEFDSETYPLSEGINRLYDIIFIEGINVLTFRGTGTVSIKYIGGSL